MSQLQWTQPAVSPPGRTRAPGAAAAPGVMGPAGAGRSPGSVLSIHGGSWEAATSPGGKGTGPGPRYSQEVAAHGGGDEHRDDHPAETPALAREGPAPKPPTPRHPRYPPEPPLTRGSAPWARTRGRRCPQGPRRRRRGRAAARSCAPSWPLRTDSAPPTAAPRRQSAPGARRAVTSHWRRRSARPGSARIGSARHPHPSAPRSAKEHPARHIRFTKLLYVTKFALTPAATASRASPAGRTSPCAPGAQGLGRPCVRRCGSPGGLSRRCVTWELSGARS